jgi:hypothetical protein
MRTCARTHERQCASMRPTNAESRRAPASLVSRRDTAQSGKAIRHARGKTRARSSLRSASKLSRARSFLAPLRASFPAPPALRCVPRLSAWPSRKKQSLKIHPSAPTSVQISTPKFGDLADLPSKADSCAKARCIRRCSSCNAPPRRCENNPATERRLGPPVAIGGPSDGGGQCSHARPRPPPPPHAVRPKTPLCVPSVSRHLA